MRVVRLGAWVAGYISALGPSSGHGTGSVTQHSDVSDAGSGKIITDAERTALGEKIGSATVSTVVVTNQATYDGLGTPAVDTLYLITES